MLRGPMVACQDEGSFRSPIVNLDFEIESHLFQTTDFAFSFPQYISLALHPSSRPCLRLVSLPPVGESVGGHLNSGKIQT